METHSIVFTFYAVKTAYLETASLFWCKISHFPSFSGLLLCLQDLSVTVTKSYCCGYVPCMLNISRADSDHSFSGASITWPWPLPESVCWRNNTWNNFIQLGHLILHIFLLYLSGFSETSRYNSINERQVWPQTLRMDRSENKTQNQRMDVSVQLEHKK